MALGTYLDYLDNKIEAWLFTPEAKAMARVELTKASLEIGA
jgi:hypothetical protein